jgi:hypothetical protein
VQGITNTGDVVFGQAVIKVKNEEEKNDIINKLNAL